MNRIEEVLINVDPLNFGKTSKVTFTDRDAIMVKLLRDDNVRTMDIAKMMDISERSVTRLLAKAKLFENPMIDLTLLDEIKRMKQYKADEESTPILDRSKMEIFHNLLNMNVKSEDIAKMLNITEENVEILSLKYKYK